MSDTVLVAIIAGLFSTTTGALSVFGIWLTRREVKTVRVENTGQHQAAKDERESQLELLQRAHDKILGRVDLVHEDVRVIGDRVAIVGQKLEDHIKSPH